MTQTTAIMMTNDGTMVLHTARTYISQCEEYCTEYWNAPTTHGVTVWERMKQLGYKVVLAELKLIDT